MQAVDAEADTSSEGAADEGGSDASTENPVMGAGIDAGSENPVTDAASDETTQTGPQNSNADATISDATTVPPDTSLDGGQEACTPNACGGCGTLATTVDASCGMCGSYECDAGVLWCNDPGTTNSCPTWCSSQPIPTGVAARDYQCVDFDNGTPPSSTWVQTVTGGGMVSRSMVEWDSPSYSLMSSVNTGSSDIATLTWTDVGSTAVSSVSLTAAIDPVTAISLGTPWGNTYVNLMCISTGHNQTCLSYTYDGTTTGANNYTGYMVSKNYSGGIATFSECGVTPSLNTSLWNTVELIVTPGTGTVQVFANGMSAASCPDSFDTDTNASVSVGLSNNGTTGAGWTAYFDNIVAAVHR
jgi:hypothetical protein